MINSVDTPELIYPVTILKIDEKIINTDGIDTILNENRLSEGIKINGQVKKNYKRATIYKSLY